MTQPNNLIDQVKGVFEQVTYMDFSSVEPEASLEDDLGIDMDSDYPRIVAQLKKRFHLHSDAAELLEEAATLKQVVGIIAEETELG